MRGTPAAFCLWIPQARGSVMRVPCRSLVFQRYNTTAYRGSAYSYLYVAGPATATTDLAEWARRTGRCSAGTVTAQGRQWAGLPRSR